MLANAMTRLGIRESDHVGVLCSNSIEYLEIAYACAKMKAVSLHINWRLTSGEIRYFLRGDKVGALFADGDLTQSYSGLLIGGALPPICVCVGGELPGASPYEQLLAAESAEYTAKSVSDDDILMHINSSGTTGIPKSILYTHRSMVSEILCYTMHTNLYRETVFQQMSPMFHSAALGAYSAIGAGATVVLPRAFQVGEYLRLLQQERVTRIAVVPKMLRQLLEHPELDHSDLSSLDTITYSGSPMPAELIDLAVGRFHCDFYQSYGMTEMGPVISVLFPEDHKEKTARSLRHRYSVGRALIGTDIRVVDDEGNDCVTGQVGEIIARGYGMMQGYHNMPEATAKALRGGWYYSGDMGYFDEFGYLFLVGRRTDMIISGGENIYPVEVEDCIRMLSADVEEVAVAGLPDAEWGEAVTAFIVKRAGSTLTAEQVIRHCMKHIASYKKPQAVYFVNELPKNASGKVVKKRLRKEFPAIRAENKTAY